VSVGDLLRIRRRQSDDLLDVQAGVAQYRTQFGAVPLVHVHAVLQRSRLLTRVFGVDRYNRPPSANADATWRKLAMPAWHGRCSNAEV
jgi:hypothetical protein